MDDYELYLKRCRLCTSEHRLGLNLFGKEGVALNLKDKIKIYLSIEVCLEDELPKEVCYQCLYRIEAFHGFKESCIQSELTLRNWQFYEDVSSKNKSSISGCESASPPEASETNRLSVESVAQSTTSSVFEITEKVMNDRRYKLQPSADVSKSPEQKKPGGKIDVMSSKNNRNVVRISDTSPKDPHQDNSEVSRILLNMSGVGTIAVTKFQGAENNEIGNAGEEDEVEVVQPPEYLLDSDDEESDGFSGFDIGRTSDVTDTEELKDDSLYVDELLPTECIQIEHVEIEEDGTVHLAEQPSQNYSPQKDMKFEDSLESMMVTTVDESGTTRYACGKCGKTYAQKGYIKEHMKIHTGEKPFTCTVCNRSFRNNYMLKVHSRLHTGEKNFKCEVCGALFTERGALVSHSRIHTGVKPFVCQYCGRKFAQNPALRRHVRIHTKERPYTCDHCEASFADRGTWRNHVRTHTGERPYDCRLCGRSFVQRTNLQTHIRTHTDERPFNCRVCGSSFRTKAHLVKHLSTIHKDVMKSVITYHKGIALKGGVEKTEPMT